MNRLILLPILVLLLSFSVRATEPMIHVIIASDIRAGFNANLITDRHNIEHMFRSNVPNNRLHLVAMRMDEITPDSILQTVKEIEPTEDDTLVFYYSGHAASTAGNGGQFFQLKDEQGKPVELQRRTLLAALHEKNARLTVLLTDCGNVEEEESAEKSVQTTPETKEPGYRLNDRLNGMSPIFESLFIKPEGTVDITSSKRGEASFVDATPNRRGSCFTWSLVALVEKHRNNSAITWQEFTEELTEAVNQAFFVSYPEGYKFNPPLNGIVLQTTQTIEIYGTLPGTETASATSQQGPRFGVRAVALHGGGGVRITQILPGGPGARAGFEVGDIITEINGKIIQNEEDYSQAIDDSPKQVNAKVINIKDGRLLNVNFELGY